MPLTGFAFAGDTLDRADALRDDTDALTALWPAARVMLLDDDGRAMANTPDVKAGHAAAARRRSSHDGACTA